MRCYVNAASKALVILLTSAYTLLTACHGSYEPLTQPNPLSENQEWMVSEMRRFEPMLDMGMFIATFTDPPHPAFAGWAECRPGGEPPWYVHFNRGWIELLTMDKILSNGQNGRDYMSALVAHEMCHHWVTKKYGGCYNEVGAETCAFNLVSKGRPE
jgi:hypothetical protein